MLAGKREINKGQPELRVLRSRAATSEEVEFPCVEQVALLRRHLRQHSPEVVALVTSLPPAEFNAAQWLADNRAAWGIDQGRENLKELSMAKYIATEAGSKCADKAIQIHGGWGFMDDCPVSRYYRDNRVCTIGDGSSQIQKLLIARECGLDVTFT